MDQLTCIELLYLFNYASFFLLPRQAMLTSGMQYNQSLSLGVGIGDERMQSEEEIAVLREGGGMEVRKEKKRKECIARVGFFLSQLLFFLSFFWPRDVNTSTPLIVHLC